MRPILFHIPLDRPWNLGPLGFVPGFGFGIVLAIWIAIGIRYVVTYGRATGWKKGIAEDWFLPIIWLFGAAFITFGAPELGKFWRGLGPGPFQDGAPIFGYGLMLATGFMMGAVFAARRAESVGLSREVIWELAPWLIIPGIVGARLYYLVEYGDKVFGGRPLIEWPLAAINLSQGGIVLYGALLGGAAGYFSFCYFYRIRPLGLADIVTPSVFVGIGFGRIGCLLYSCCYGRITDLPWGIQFPRDCVAFQGMLEKHLVDPTAICTPPLHPTQIYSSIDGFMIAAITSWYFWRRRRNGEVLAVALIIYPITRFLLETLRADEVGQFGLVLKNSQWVSIGLFLINLVYMYYLSRRPPVRDPIIVPLESVSPRGAATTALAR